MTTSSPKPWRSASTLIASTVIALGLMAALSGCGPTGFGTPGDAGVDASPSPSASAGDDHAAEPQIPAAQLGASECFPGIWEMDNNTMSSLLVEVGLLVSDSIEGTSLMVVQPDGTMTVEHIGWTYVVKAPPNPILGGQAPTTLTITNDSSLSATYGIDEAGTITVTLVDDGSLATSDKTPRALTCEGDRVIEKVKSMDGEIVFHRRG